MSNLLHKNNNDEQEGMEKFQYIPKGNADQNRSDGLDPQKIIAMLLKYKWAILLLLTAGGIGALLYANTVTPTYESNGSLLISSADKTPTDELSKIISRTTGHGTSSTIENELQVLQSRKFSLQVAKRVVEQDSGGRKSHPILWGSDENGDPKKLSQEGVAARIEKRVSFRKLEEKADVVGVSFTSSSPEEAASVVNAVMETYIETSTQQSRKAARATTDFLASEREKLQKKLRNSEQGLRQYMDSTGI